MSLSSPLGGATNLSSLQASLPSLYCAPLSDTAKKRLEYEFHSASYHILAEVVVGLRTLLYHFIKVSDVVTMSL